jgi:hypothetical protein
MYTTTLGARLGLVVVIWYRYLASQHSPFVLAKCGSSARRVVGWTIDNFLPPGGHTTNRVVVVLDVSIVMVRITSHSKSTSTCPIERHRYVAGRFHCRNSVHTREEYRPCGIDPRHSVPWLSPRANPRCSDTHVACRSPLILLGRVVSISMGQVQSRPRATRQ